MTTPDLSPRGLLYTHRASRPDIEGWKLQNQELLHSDSHSDERESVKSTENNRVVAQSLSSEWLWPVK